jgi:hypothetical protein
MRRVNRIDLHPHPAIALKGRAVAPTVPPQEGFVSRSVKSLVEMGCHGTLTGR